MAKKRKKGLAAVLGTVISVAVPIFAPAIAGAIGLSGAVASAAVGAVGGAAGSALSGNDPLLGAVTGGVGGFLSGGGLGLDTSSAASGAKGVAEAGVSTPGFGTAFDKVASPLLPSNYVYAGKDLESVYSGTQLVTPNVVGPQTFNGGVPGAALAPSPISPATPSVTPAVAPKAAPSVSSGIPQQAGYQPQPSQQGPLDLNTPTNPGRAGLDAASAPTQYTQSQGVPQDPNNAVAAQRAANAQTATGKTASAAPAAQTAARPQEASGLRGALGRVDLNTALRLGGALLSPGEAEMPDYDELFSRISAPGNPQEVNQDVLDSARNQDNLNQEQWKYQFDRTRQLANYSDQMDPQEYARMQALIEGERAGTLSREQQRELARRRGRNTGKRGAAGQRRAGLDLARATAVGDRSGYERGLAAKITVDNAARQWLPQNFQAADATRLNASTSNLNAQQQEELWRRQKYELEQAAAQRERERTATIVGLTTNLFNRQPGRPTERDLWA